jgi:hypothetical protein
MTKAKCKLCNSIIESNGIMDCVACPCGNIAIRGTGKDFECKAKDWNSFLIVEDDQEIKVRVKNENTENDTTTSGSVCEADSGNTVCDGVVLPKSDYDDPGVGDRQAHSKEYLINELERMIKNIEDLPQHAMLHPVTHYDLYSFMLVVSSLFRAS